MDVVAFNRTLEQELLALARGVSMECPVCGEFVQKRGRDLVCGECGSVLRDGVQTGEVQLRLDSQAG